MMYYGTGLSLLGGIESTPLRSLLSKCVGLDEFGKIFTMSSTASSLASLLGAFIVPKIYKATVETFPGAVYVFMASVQLLTVILMFVLYLVILKHEKVYGVIGSEQDEAKTEDDPGSARPRAAAAAQRESSPSPIY